MAQMLFVYNGDAERTRLAQLLIERGYDDSEEMVRREPEARHVPCVCLDLKSKRFYPISPCAAACCSQSGTRFYTADEAEGIVPEISKPKHTKKRRLTSESGDAKDQISAGGAGQFDSQN